MPSRRKHYDISEPAQVEALASPVRQEIVDAAQALGACSIAQIAAAIGRPADGLYYHVKHLVAVGLLEEAGSRRGVRRNEALYRTPGQFMRMKQPESGEGIVGVNAAMMRVTARDFRRAVKSKDVVLTGPRRNTYSGRVTGWLTETQLAEVNDLLVQAMERFGASAASERAQLHALTVVLVPARHERRRRSKGA